MNRDDQGKNISIASNPDIQKTVPGSTNTESMKSLETRESKDDLFNTSTVFKNSVNGTILGILITLALMVYRLFDDKPSYHVIAFFSVFICFHAKFEWPKKIGDFEYWFYVLFPGLVGLSIWHGINDFFMNNFIMSWVYENLRFLLGKIIGGAAVGALCGLIVSMNRECFNQCKEKNAPNQIHSESSDHP